MNLKTGFKTTSWWICIYLCAGCIIDPTICFGQLREADSLSVIGKFKEAGYLYEKAAWSAEDPAQQAIFYLSRIGCLQMESRHHQALHVLEQINLSSLPDSLVSQIQFAAVLSSYLDGQFKSAISYTLQLLHPIGNADERAAYLYLLALCYNETFEYARADSVCKIMLAQLPISEKGAATTAALTALYREVSVFHPKDPETARKWSTFIPGAGQIYAGYTGEGILNFMLQAASLGFIGYHIYISYYLTAFTVGSGVFQHLYFGGIRRAGYLADKRNYITRKQHNDALREQIMVLQSQINSKK